MRGKGVVKNTFKILRTRLRILGRPVKATVENVDQYLLAIIALHNYLQQTEMPVTDLLGLSTAKRLVESSSLENGEV